MLARVTIHRKDWEHPFVHVAYWSECKQVTRDKDGSMKLNSMWQKMGKFMLKKVATAQAFRLCFPDEMGGLPYTADELPDNMTAGFNEVKNVTPEPVAIPEEKKKGDYKQAATAIGAAKTIAEIEKYSKMLSTRTWTDDESELLDNLIEDKRTEIGGK